MEMPHHDHDIRCLSSIRAKILVIRAETYAPLTRVSKVSRLRIDNLIRVLTRELKQRIGGGARCTVLIQSRNLALALARVLAWLGPDSNHTS